MQLSTPPTNNSGTAVGWRLLWPRSAERSLWRTPTGGSPSTARFGLDRRRSPLAGGLPARWVVHVVGPRYREGEDNAARLREAVRAALDSSAEIGAKTVAMPAISAGVFGYPLEAAAELIASECLEWVSEHPGRLSEIRLVGYNRRAADAFRAGLEKGVG